MEKFHNVTPESELIKHTRIFKCTSKSQAEIKIMELEKEIQLLRQEHNN